MRSIRDFSIKTKLLLLSAASVVVALCLSCAGFTINEFYSIRSQKIDELENQAGMVALGSSSVLVSRDTAAARHVMDALNSLPAVQFACLYAADGTVLAVYPKGADPGRAPPVQPETSRFRDDGDFETYRQVFDRDRSVGTLYLSANVSDLQGQLAQYGKIMVYVVLLSLSVSVLLASRLQRAISTPILYLARTASRITSAEDFSIRVYRDANDELGTLYAEFNRMLTHIQQSERALKRAHDELEQRVVERTAELCQEIAEREKAQAELVRAKTAAEDANVSKSRFLANMSHEIRTPLNAILGFADLLRRSHARCDEAERQDYLETIHTSGKHLLSLINDILDLSKIEADRLEVERVACSPHQLINEVVSVLRVRAMEKGLSLEYRWLSVVPERIETDPARLRQLLVNLVGNAIKFTQVGSVKILAELQADAATPRLAIQVVDSGIGISADKLESIFDPFVQADSSVTRQFGGTGLGLTISRRIAEALGGGIRVTSEVGTGSTFTVSIPTGPLDGIALLASPPTDGLKRAPTASESQPIHLNSGKVLLAEDGDTNRKLISLLLRRVGLEVATAGNGQIAVDLATRHPFDLILMDMQMPVMDGYTAAARIRELGLDMPIIALTAHAMKGDEDKCRAAGCTGYLTKPIDADLLIRTVAAVLPGNGAGESVRPADSAGNPPEEDRAASPAAAAAGPPLVSTLPTEDPDFREIVEEFVERLDGQLATMANAHAEKDMDELARLAHWLKGAGGTAGFPQVTDPARDLEQQAKNYDVEQAAATINLIRNISERMAAGLHQTADAVRP